MDPAQDPRWGRTAALNERLMRRAREQAHTRNLRDRLNSWVKGHC